jgi:hypothetical protein
VHYQYKGKDTTTGFNRSQLMQLTIAALPRGSDVMWCVLADSGIVAVLGVLGPINQNT